MSRNLLLGGMACVFAAFVLQFLVSISLPYLTAIDFARAKVANGGSLGGSNGLEVIEARFGTWAPCIYTSSKRICGGAQHGYAALFGDADGHIAIITASWTRGLAIHPVCTVVLAIAFGLALSSRSKHRLYASLISVLAAVLVLIAFAIDIALWARVKNRMGILTAAKLDTTTAPAFWMTFVSLVLAIASSGLLFIGSRGDDGDSSYAMSSGSWFSKFRK